MFRILLADDEPHHLIRLTKLIENLDLPFEVCGIANNGRKAMELTRSLHPDIIISDIRMPFCDGLAVSEAVKKERPDIPIILISAYQDFEYARKGLQLGILDYLLKPVEESKVIEVLKKAENSLTETKTNLLRRILFNSSGKDRQSSTRITQTLNSLKPYKLALYLNQPSSTQSLIQLWQKTGKLTPAYCLEIEARGDGCRLFLFSGSSSYQQSLEDSGISNGFLILSQENPVYENWENDCLRMTQKIWENGKWSQSGLFDATMKQSRKASSPLFSQDVEWELRLHLKTNREEDFFLILEKILRNGMNRQIPLISLSEGIRALDRILTEHYSLRLNIPQSIIHQIIENLIRKLSSFDFQPELIVEELKTRIHWALPDETSPFSIENIKEYIQKNFKDNIDSSSLADMSGVSIAILNTAFKVETGLSPTKYLLSVRMEAAKRLLSYDPPQQIKEISWETGYEDPLYFSRIFHKKTGMYPTEYREKMIRTLKK
ncbi:MULTISPECIES: response regulator [unclassified Oceanispirochaeta]|uniref:response regulator n=1 Tax=unclassified Oceanispirochaeta TaxID=2635722 RepID=UPI000E096DE0|nr:MULTISPECIES: response regulator [unclassified Oceanispirochaeta]MBF9016547.1 response regulator [Oceanispirochaeta sp. M2]NPD73009.1 response regulator [Oceanispirochaeta sp. M1]RDG31353.1 response regulator [Oceanispirochaeta sp. M1]